MRRSTTPKRHDRSQHPDVTKPGAHQSLRETQGGSNPIVGLRLRRLGVRVFSIDTVRGLVRTRQQTAHDLGIRDAISADSTTQRAVGAGCAGESRQIRLRRPIDPCNLSNERIRWPHEHRGGELRDYRQDFDFNDPSFAEGYLEILSDLRENCPVARSNAGEGYWVVTRYDDVARVSREWETFSSAWPGEAGVGPGGFIINRPEGIEPMLPIEMDPPRHREWRATLNPHFTLAQIRPLEEQIKTISHEIVDGFIDQGTCEFVREFGAPFAERIMSEAILNLPAADMPHLRDAITRAIFGTVLPDGSREFDPAGFTDVYEYAYDHIKSSRASDLHHGDVVSAILDMTIDDGPPVTDEERARVLYTLIFAGLDTTTSTIAGTIKYLAENPELHAQLLSSPGDHPEFIEEAIRLFNPGVCMARYATKDTEIAGQPIKKGDQVAFFHVSANHDPAEFGDPALDLERSSNRHLALGFGVHRCLGNHQARLSLTVGVSVLLERLGSLKITAPDEVEIATNQRRQILSLPLSFVSLRDETKQ